MQLQSISRRRAIGMIAAMAGAIAAGSRTTRAHDGMDHGSASPVASPGLGPTGGGTAGVRCRIVNNGSGDDRLIGGSTPVAGTVEIHEMAMQGDVMKMVPLPDGLPIASGETIDMNATGEHLMLIGLRQDLRDGDTFELTLEFEQAGSVVVTVPVYTSEQAAAAAGPGTPVISGDLTIDTIWARAAPALLDIPAVPSATPVQG